MANKKKKILVRTLWIGIISPFAIIIISLLLVGMGVFGELPSFEELESPKSNVATNIISEDGKNIGSFFIQNRSFVSYEELSENLVDALIATEDARYHNHSGIDFISLARVGFKTILMGDRQGGGSTISQQLAKNLYPRDTSRNDSSIERAGKIYISKLKEWITASMLERNYTKEEIIAMYLNIVEYGSNAFGIKSASKIFFNKLPSEVTVEEAAVLIGVVNAPTRYSPVRNPNNALKRRNLVINRMITNQNISKHEGDSILQIPITLDFAPITHNAGSSTYFRAMLAQYMNANEPKRNHYYLQWDYEMALKRWKEDPLYGWCNKNTKADGTKYNIYRDGLTIYTTINSEMQTYAEDALNNHLKNSLQPAFDRQARADGTIFYNISSSEEDDIIWSTLKQSDRYREYKQKGKSDSEIKKLFNTKTKLRVFSYEHPNGRDTLMSPMDSMLISMKTLRSSFVAMTPQTGHVKAYVGGQSFRFFKYDMAMQGKRQPGSTIKPFIYTFAVDHLGLDPCTPVPNSPVTVEGWTPKEAGNPEQIGELRPLWWGLAKSRNNFSAWIIKQSNYNAVADLIHKMGIDSYIDPVQAMCLGPSDVSLYEMVNAYTTFANMGVHVDPIFVTRIEDKNGNVVGSFSPSTNDVITQKSAYQILEMLQKVTSPQGTGARIRWMYNIEGDLGGKTGTTDNNSDAWFIGVTPNLVAGVWVGGDRRSIHLNGTYDAARIAMPIFGGFMQKVHANSVLGVKPSDKFILPEGVVGLDCNEETVVNDLEQKAKEEELRFFN